MSDEQPTSRPLRSSPPQASVPAEEAQEFQKKERPAKRLPQFALLAEPDTIAAPTSAPTSTSPASPPPHRLTGPRGPMNARPRLDSTAARTMREEARRRSDSSLAELLAARESLGQKRPDVALPGQWQTRPLVSRAAVIEEAPPTPAPDQSAPEQATAEQISVLGNRVDALEKLLSQRDADLAERTASLNDLRERFDAQIDALERTRAALEQERCHRTREIRREEDGAEKTSFSAAATEIAVPSKPIAAPPSLAPIFDTWLDDQIRRHFGPLGVDRLADLLHQRIERRKAPHGPTVQIAWMANDGHDALAELAKELHQNLGTPFQLHVIGHCAALADKTAKVLASHPASAFIQSTGSIDSAAKLRKWLTDTTPDLVICRHFLSEQTNPGEWIDALRSVPEAKNDLVLIERTGLGAETPSDAQAATGERIWELMPTRYKQTSDGETISRWTEAFSRTEKQRAGGILHLLRERFEFALSAQFGFLSDAFIATPIGSNFSANTPKDRRFLRQIGDLDEKRIEAGSAPALHSLTLIVGDPDSV